jgi:lipoate-protein ligase A
MEDERPAHREFVMEVKVPGGKLARLRIGLDGAVRLSGDFFVYPEEGIFLIEKVLSDLQGDEPLDAVESAIKAIVEENRIQLVGLDVPVIARLYRSTVDVESHRP